MGYGLSVDVGTSFTAAAIIRTDGERPGAPEILPLGGRAAVIPTVVFLGTDGTMLVGDAAERRGAAHPEGVAREFKRRMGDDVPLLVGGDQVLPQQLIAAVVGWVVGVATEREGGAPDVVTLTHPAGWGGHRTSLLRQALAEAGVGDVVLLTEPEAAALSYASRERVPAGSTLAVYDLGGGTFDATVLRKTDADTFEVLGTPQGLDRLGGADFDQEIFDHVLDSTDLPAAGPDASPEVLAALTRLRKECAETKEALSSDSEATVSVMMPGAHTQVRLVRSEFEAMIAPALTGTLTTLRAALESAGVQAEDLTAILLIGGSSRIPLVAQLLSEEFGRPLAIDVDPKASVALGAAFATSVLDDASVQEGPAAPGEEATVPQGRAAVVTNAAGFAMPAPRAPLPAHGPAAMAPNRRLGVRIGAVAAAVALLGIATASATNAPNPLAALSALGGDPPAVAAEGPQPTAGAGSTAAATGEPGAPADITSAPGETFLDEARELIGSAPSPSGEAQVGPLRGAGAEGTSGPTTTAGRNSSTRDASREDAAAGDKPSTAPSRTAGPSSAAPAKPASPAKSAAPPPAAPSPAGPSPAGPSPVAPSSPKPGTTPGSPTPPVPFPTQPPAEPPAPPVTEAPPVTLPTPPPAPEPTPDPTQPPAAEPTPEPTQPPVDPAPVDPPPPPADPAPQPTSVVEAPAPTDPPPPGEPVAPSSIAPGF